MEDRREYCAVPWGSPCFSWLSMYLHHCFASPCHAMPYHACVSLSSPPPPPRSLCFPLLRFKTSPTTQDYISLVLPEPTLEPTTILGPPGSKFQPHAPMLDARSSVLCFALLCFPLLCVFSSGILSTWGGLKTSNLLPLMQHRNATQGCVGGGMPCHASNLWLVSPVPT